MKKTIAVITLFIFMISALTGCSSTKNFLGGGDKKAETITSNDVYIAIEKVRTLNPILSKDEDSYYIDKLIYDGLFQLNDHLEAEPVLASSYSYSNDGYTLTIDLKSGVKWHDGEDFTASDVKFSIDAYTSTPDSLYYPYVSNIRSVTVKRSDQVVINFKTNTNSSIENFTFPIVAKHQFRSMSKAKTMDEKFVPVGTGCYKVESYDNYFELVLAANPQWHMGSIGQNRLLFEVIPNRDDVVNMVGMSKVSLSFSKDMDREAKYANRKVTMTDFPSNEVEFIGFNFGKKLFQNKMARQAVAYATDTKKIIKTCYYGNGILNDNIYYPDYFNVDSKKDLYAFNTKKALKLLNEAGYLDQNGDGKLEDSEGNKLTVNILVNSEDPARIAAAEIIKTGLDKLQIDSYITQVEWNVYNSAIARGDYDIYIGGYEIRDNYDMRFLLHSDYNNPIGYSNPDLDVLLDKMESGLTTEMKKETFSEIKKMLDDEIPYYCLLYKTYAAVTPSTFKGTIQSLFNNFYRDCQSWQCVYDKVETTTEAATEE